MPRRSATIPPAPICSAPSAATSPSLSSQMARSIKILRFRNYHYFCGGRGTYGHSSLRFLKKELDSVYGSIQRFHLYDTNSPFEGDQWALIGITEENMLLSLSAHPAVHLRHHGHRFAVWHIRCVLRQQPGDAPHQSSGCQPGFQRSESDAFIAQKPIFERSILFQKPSRSSAKMWPILHQSSQKFWPTRRFLWACLNMKENPAWYFAARLLPRL